MADLCHAHEFPGLRDSLDREFIFGKGRRVSLSERFADLFAEAGTQILVRRKEQAIASALVLRHFTLNVGVDTVPLKGIGLVWTLPTERGQGYGRQLLADAIALSRKSDAAAIVLWTTRASFYEHLGFRLADSGRYALAQPQSVPNTNLDVQIVNCPLSEQSLTELEVIRARDQDVRVSRQAGNWRRKPPPAEDTGCIVARSNNRIQAYALFGLSTDGTYLYEICGDPDCFAALWNALTDFGRVIHINDCLGSRSFSWFSQSMPSLPWREQNQSFWLSLQAGQAVPAHWHIPYLDRF